MAENQKVELKVPYPSAAGLHLIIRVNGCHVDLKRGDHSEWVQGSSSFKRPPGPTVEQVGGEVTIIQEYMRSELTNMFRVAADSPRLALELGSAQPFNLTVDNLADVSHLDLGGLPLQNVRISQKMGPGELDFSAMNSVPMEYLEIDTQAGKFEARNLANANFKRLTLLGTAATYKLNFGGSLQHDAIVEVAPKESPTTISIPNGLAVKVEPADGSPFDPESHELKLDGTFISQAGCYCTKEAIAGNSPLLTIQIKPLGPISLDSYKG